MNESIQQDNNIILIIPIYSDLRVSYIHYKGE